MIGRIAGIHKCVAYNVMYDLPVTLVLTLQCVCVCTRSMLHMALLWQILISMVRKVMASHSLIASSMTTGISLSHTHTAIVNALYQRSFCLSSV
jgi:hypothetical protein